MRKPFDGRLGLAAAAAVVAAGCGQRDAALPRPLGACPPPLTWSAGEPRPRAVRIANRTPDTVLVFLDRCRGHNRVGEVAPGRSRLFELPGPLVEVRGGLTFHAFVPRTTSYHSRTTVPLDTVAILDLALEPREEVACAPRLFVNGESFEGSLRDIPAETIAGIQVEDPPRGSGECRRIHVTTHRGV